MAEPLADLNPDQRGRAGEAIVGPAAAKAGDGVAGSVVCTLPFWVAGTEGTAPGLAGFRPTNNGMFRVGLIEVTGPIYVLAGEGIEGETVVGLTVTVAAPIPLEFTTPCTLMLDGTVPGAGKAVEGVAVLVITLLVST